MWGRELNPPLPSVTTRCLMGKGGPDQSVPLESGANDVPLRMPHRLEAVLGTGRLRAWLYSSKSYWASRSREVPALEVRFDPL